MGFYKSKLEKYLKNMSVNTDNLENYRKRITEGLAHQLDEYLEDMKYAPRTEIFGISEIPVEEIFKNSMVAEHELKFLKTLSDEDFFHYLVNVENYDLIQVENREKEIRDAYDGKVQKYINKEGLVGKASNLFGTDRRKIEKNSKLRDNAQRNLDYAIESRSEFNSLKEEEQVAYIIGRYEFDGKTKFDVKGFEEYKESLRINEQEQQSSSK